MIQEKQNSDWRANVNHAVNVFSFLIRGEGEMSGRKFAKHILGYCSSDKAKILAEDVKNHIVRIDAGWSGTKYWYC